MTETTTPLTPSAVLLLGQLNAAATSTTPALSGPVVLNDAGTQLLWLTDTVRPIAFAQTDQVFHAYPGYENHLLLLVRKDALSFDRQGGYLVNQPHSETSQTQREALRLQLCVHSAARFAEQLHIEAVQLNQITDYLHHTGESELAPIAQRYRQELSGSLASNALRGAEIDTGEIQELIQILGAQDSPAAGKLQAVLAMALRLRAEKEQLLAQADEELLAED